MQIYTPQGRTQMDVQEVVRSIQLVLQTLNHGTNVMGIEFTDMFRDFSPIAPGDPWSSDIREVLFEWDPHTNECRIVQVFLANGAIYGPHAK